MPIIVDHPEWKVLLSMDGFTSHVNSLEAIKIFAEHNILLVQEPADSSHANQAYDQFIGKSDKRWVKELLDAYKHLMKGKVIDQWTLMTVSCIAFKHARKEDWIASFRRVNMHPDFWLEFAEWCDKLYISNCLTAGSKFQVKPESKPFDLTAPLWQGKVEAPAAACSCEPRPPWCGAHRQSSLQLSGCCAAEIARRSASTPRSCAGCAPPLRFQRWVALPPATILSGTLRCFACVHTDLHQSNCRPRAPAGPPLCPA